MVIDYLYLILILVLISCILFIIYLSYQYRVNDINRENHGSHGSHGSNGSHDSHGKHGSESSIERFTLQPLHEYKDNLTVTNINNQASNMLNDYNRFKIGIYNKQIYKDNENNKNLLANALSNVSDSKKLNMANKQPPPVVNKFPIDKLISTIKSRYNSQYLSTFANDSVNYGVLANDKCLTVNGLCKDDYCLLECQNSLYTTDSQKFATKRIYSADDASRIMHTDPSKISSQNIYPFNIFTSLVNNNCLTIGDEGITVEKCNLNNIKQQWDISPDENICVLN